MCRLLLSDERARKKVIFAIMFVVDWWETGGLVWIRQRNPLHSASYPSCPKYETVLTLHKKVVPDSSRSRSTFISLNHKNESRR